MPQRHQLAPPVMRRTARLHPDKAGRQRGEEGQNIAATECPGNDKLAARIDRVNLKNVLGQIKASVGDNRKIRG